jgi:uncharacterized protein YjbJ (UPF0337 family)
MGAKDKVSNTAQDIKGKLKEAAGKATGNEQLERKGKRDQAKSAVKDVGEKAKEAASNLKDTVTKK